MNPHPPQSIRRLLLCLTVAFLFSVAFDHYPEPSHPTAAMAQRPQTAPTAIETSVTVIEATPTPEPIPVKGSAYQSTLTGSAHDWYLASGINQDWELVNWLVSKESGWNPNAVNRSSGACGLGQQLPCGKWPHQWNDPVGALIDMNQYVLSRYKSWAAAKAWHLSHGWY